MDQKVSTLGTSTSTSMGRTRFMQPDLGAESPRSLRDAGLSVCDRTDSRQGDVLSVPVAGSALYCIHPAEDAAITRRDADTLSMSGGRATVRL